MYNSRHIRCLRELNNSGLGIGDDLDVIKDIYMYGYLHSAIKKIVHVYTKQTYMTPEKTALKYNIKSKNIDSQ